MKILIIEDDLVYFNDLRNKLLSNDYQVEEKMIRTKKSALDYLKDRNMEIDLIIIDISLCMDDNEEDNNHVDNMEGISIAEELQKLYDIPFIYLSSYSPEVVNNEIKRRAHSFYYKKESNEKIFNEFLFNIDTLYENWKKNKSNEKSIKKFFDSRVWDKIKDNPSLLDSKYKKITVAFWDIRGFSMLCENLKEKPLLIKDLLITYFSLASDVIFKHNGVLDKFIGDGIMAIFGSLEAKPSEKSRKNSVCNAIDSAFEMRDIMKDQVIPKYLKKWRKKVANKIDIGLGCGIHIGESIVGNLGTAFRDQYTAIGPHVNFASRLESKSPDQHILVSETAHAYVEDQYEFIYYDEWNDIKNIPGKFRIYNAIRKKANNI
jgi:class 3 adenylate cyclase